MNPTIEQLEAAIAAANEKLAELKAQAKAEADDSRPKRGDTYFFVNGDGDVLNAQWDSDLLDASRMNIGNAFRTVAEAEHEIERRKVLTELRQLARESWGGEKCVYSQGEVVLYFNHNNNCWDTSRYAATQHIGTPGFASREAAHAAVETIGAERLKLLLED